MDERPQLSGEAVPVRLDHRQTITAYWDAHARGYNQYHPEHSDPSLHPSWGLWHVAESVLKMLGTAPLRGTQVLELGCGDGHDAVGFGRLGASVVGVDISCNQLRYALPHANVQYIRVAAENLPFSDETMDVAISDHGAFDHVPAPLLLKEMRRVLRPGGRLVVCTYSPLCHACYVETTGRLGTVLSRSYPDNAVKYDGEIVVVEYSYSAWIQMFRDYGFSIKRLEELVIPEGSTEYFGDLVDIHWASRWPCDIIWSVCKDTL